MRWTRPLAVPAVAALFALAGCGTEAPPAAGTDPEPSRTTAAVTPTTSAPAPGTSSTAPADDERLGTVVVNAPLGVEASDFPGPPTPLYAEVSGADELASLYAGVPGIEQIVAAVAASPPTANERLFVYTVAACRVADISLELTGKEVVMVVRGNTTLKCQPPPMQMVVWKVGADDVPADAVPAQAVQKR